MTARVNLELPEQLLKEIDEARGDVPRNRWIRRAIEHRLDPSFDPDKPRSEPNPNH